MCTGYFTVHISASSFSILSFVPFPFPLVSSDLPLPSNLNWSAVLRLQDSGKDKVCSQELTVRWWEISVGSTHFSAPWKALSRRRAQALQKRRLWRTPRWAWCRVKRLTGEHCGAWVEFYTLTTCMNIQLLFRITLKWFQVKKAVFGYFKNSPPFRPVSYPFCINSPSLCPSHM